MIGILQQYKMLISAWNYKNITRTKLLNLKKKIKGLEKAVKFDNNRYTEFIEQKKLGEMKINNVNTDKRLNLFFVSKSMNIKLIDRIRLFISYKGNIFKFLGYDGYVLYFNKANDMRFLKVKNLKMLWRLGKKELYNMLDKIGTFKGKPLFLVKYPYAISLNVDDSKQELYYDTESYYNLVDIAIKGGLTRLKDKTGLGDFIAQNFIKILLFGLVMFLLFSPDGQQLIQSVTQPS